MGWAVGKLESCRTAAGGAGIFTSTIPKGTCFTLLYDFFLESWGQAKVPSYNHSRNLYSFYEFSHTYDNFSTNSDSKATNVSGRVLRSTRGSRFCRYGQHLRLERHRYL